MYYDYCALIPTEPFDSTIYVWFMHAIFLVSTPINMLCGYCIILKSTKQMSVYRWYLMAFHVIVSVLDFGFSSLTVGIIFIL